MSFSANSPAEGMTMLPLSQVKYEQLEYTPLALDLCVRQHRSPSPCPEGAHHDGSQTPSRPLSSQTLRTDSDCSENGSITSDHVSYGDFASIRPKAKATRPFKAYAKDPFFLSVGLAAVNTPPLTPDMDLNKNSVEAYADFRERMLSYVRATNPPPGVTNTRMRRNTVQSPQADGKDASYWEKRRKNNEAAKRSRDARRAKEDELAIRAAFLEQENLKLKYEVSSLRNENTKLRCLLYN